MAEPTKQWSTGDQVNAADLNQTFIEVLNNYRDFTYGETIAINDALYLKASDGKVYKTSAAANDEKIWNFIGFAKEAGNVNDVKKVQISGKVSGLSGLTTGSFYLLSDTAGAISTTGGTIKKVVSLALSTTILFILANVLTEKDQNVYGVKTFGSIPVLPASDPTTDNEVTRKAYTDTMTHLFKYGTASRNMDAASGDQIIAHGLGKTPKFVRITCFTGLATQPWIRSIGVYNVTTANGIYVGWNGTAATMGSCNMAFLQNNTGNQAATISVDATNITLTWTKTGTTTAETIYILWEAYY